MNEKKPSNKIGIRGNESLYITELEGCIDDKRQFETAKRLVRPLF